MKARNNDFLAKYENYPLRNEIQEGILLQSVCVRLIQLEMLTLMDVNMMNRLLHKAQIYTSLLKKEGS